MTPRIILFATILFILNVFCTSCQSHNSFSDDEVQLIRAGAPGDMMRLYTIDSPSDSLLLRTESADVSEEMMHSEDFRQLTDRMLTTVLNPDNTGVGIAAPQVGILRRIVLLQRFDMEGEPFKIFVNPEIISLSEDRKLGPEGCLSIPGYRGLVPRATEVVIRYIDGETFEPCEETISGFTAVIVQHETDHLYGRLYIDRTDPDSLTKTTTDEEKK